MIGMGNGSDKKGFVRCSLNVAPFVVLFFRSGPGWPGLSAHCSALSDD